MFLNYKMLFTMILMMGSLISISSNTWMGMWLGLEINLMAFIPLISEKNNTLSSESAVKYFLTQALASVILLFTMIYMSKNLLIMKNIENLMIIMFNSTLLMKMGMSPFHFWFPEVIDGLNWINCFILLVWQKITPMILVMYNINIQYFFMIIITMNMLISGFMGLNQTSLRKIMAYSSINHMAWMISAMFFSETIWFYYFIIYSILSINLIMIFKLMNIYYYNQLLISLNNNIMMKFLFSLNFLSLGGLPPFIGFFSKWLTIQHMMHMCWTLMSMFMIMITLLTLFFYTRLIFNILILNNIEVNYYSSLKFKNSFLIWFNMISIFNLSFCTVSFNFL